MFETLKSCRLFDAQPQLVLDINNGPRQGSSPASVTSVGNTVRNLGNADCDPLADLLALEDAV